MPKFVSRDSDPELKNKITSSQTGQNKHLPFAKFGQGHIFTAAAWHIRFTNAVGTPHCNTTL